jgi:prophage regulatory protein
MNPLPSEVDRILRWPEVRQAVGLGRTKVYELIQAGEFPPPLALGGRAVGWRASEIQKWINERRLACEGRWLRGSVKRIFAADGEE